MSKIFLFLTSLVFSVSALAQSTTVETITTKSNYEHYISMDDFQEVEGGYEFSFNMYAPETVIDENGRLVSGLKFDVITDRLGTLCLRASGTRTSTRTKECTVFPSTKMCVTPTPESPMPACVIIPPKPPICKVTSTILPKTAPGTSMVKKEDVIVSGELLSSPKCIMK